MYCKLFMAISLMLGGALDERTADRARIFDTVWQTVNDGFYDQAFGGVDWKAVGKQYRPKTLGAESDEQFYRSLNAMLYELGVSHLAVIPKGHPEWIGAPSADAVGDIGADVRIIDNQMVITSIRPGSVADAAGLRPGFKIESADGKTLDDLTQKVLDTKPIPPLDRRAFFARKILEPFYGEPGTKVTFVCVDGKNRRTKKTLNREERPGRIQFMEGLPPSFIESESTRLEHNIGYIHFNAFHPALLERLLAAVDKMHDTTGLVIDIRGNGGGALPVRRALAERMVSERRLCWSYHGRRGVEDVFLTPAEKPYTGPLAILTDELSISSAEEFPGAMQAMGRAVVVGERTPGIVLVAEVPPLSSGDTLIYPVAKTVTSDGTVLEGRGVIPDIKARHTVNALLAGRDLPLEAAIRYIRAQAEN